MLQNEKTIHVIFVDQPNIHAYWLYQSYFKAIKNIYNKKYNIKKYSNINNLNNNDIVFIIDDHHLENRKIWMNKKFINSINKKNIKTIFITVEKIYNSFFSHNLNFKKEAEKIKNYYHISSDSHDSVFMDTPVAKQLFSKDFNNLRSKYTNIDFSLKKNNIIFIGKLNDINSQSWYKNRKDILSFLSNFKTNNISIELINSSQNITFENYLNLISKNKFVLNPLGIGSFLSMRFYETLFVNSVPIQQIDKGIELVYDEIENNKKGIFFKDIEDLKKIINNINFYIDFYEKNNIINFQYLEEYLEKINLLN
jgi:hypothetical protein